jgi:hypothetical protein
MPWLPSAILSSPGKKKSRKPYTITRPRERWNADEQFVTTTHAQIRSHAQKHILKAQKQGLCGGVALTHMVLSFRRQPAATLGITGEARAALWGALEHCSITVLHCSTLFFKGIRTLTVCPDIRDHEPSSAPAGDGVEWACTAAGACWPGHGLFIETPNCMRRGSGWRLTKRSLLVRPCLVAG